MGENMSKDETFQNIFGKQKMAGRVIINLAKGRRLEIKNLKRIHQQGKTNLLYKGPETGELRNVGMKLGAEIKRTS